MTEEKHAKVMPCKWYSVALLKAQVSLQLGKVSSSDNAVSVSIMYSYMY